MGLTAILVLKDVREALRDRRVLGSILIPAVILPVIALGISAGGGPLNNVEGAAIAVVNMDAGALGSEVERSLARRGADPARGDPLRLLERYGAVIYIPRNFTEGIIRGEGAAIRLYVKYRGVLAAGRYRDVEGLIRGVTSTVLSERVGAVSLEDALRIEVGILLEDRVLGEDEVGALIGASALGFFIVLFASVALSASIAVAVGTEKEKRMLELLLAAPVSFGRLIVAKTASSIILAAMQLGAIGAGFGIYVVTLLPALAGGSTGGVPEVADGLQGIVGALVHVVVVTVPLVLLTVAISLLVALRAEDLRTAQMTVPNTVFLLVFPAFLLYFAPPEALGNAAYLYPYAHPFLVPLKVFGGDPNFTALALALDSALAVLAFVGLGRYMNAERIIIGVRRGRRREGA